MPSLFRICWPLRAPARPASRLPYVLCTAPALGSPGSAETLGSPLSELAVLRRFQGLLSEASVPDAAGTAVREQLAAVSALPKSKQKDLKRRGFHTVIEWCEALQSRNRSGRDSQEDQLAATDAAALTWIQAFTPALSCGQSLVLIGFLSDALCKLGERSCELDSAGQDAATLGRLTNSINDAVSLLGLLVHRITGSDQLERQPLPAILSAAYGLHRVTAPESPLGLDEITLSSLQPPHALLFAALHNMRAGFPGSSVAQADGRAARSDGSLGDAALNTQVLITFLLIMTPTRCEELLTSGDQSILRNVLDHLLAQISPRLQSFQFLRAEGTTLRTAAAAEDEAENHERPGDKAGGGGALLDKRLSEEREDAVAADALYAPLPECLAIMRNTTFAAPPVRLALLQYLLCVLRSPAALPAAGPDLGLVAKMLDALDSVPKRHKTQLTEYIIATAPVPADAAVVAAFLRHTRHPEAYLSRISLTPDMAAQLPPLDASSMLQVGVRYYDWPVVRALIQASLLGSEDSSRLARVLAGECSAEPLVPLSPDVVAALRALLPAEGSAGDADDVEDTERQQWLARGAGAVDWSAGVVRRNGGGHPDVTALLHSKADQAVMQLALPALEVYLYGHSATLIPEALKVADKALLNRYVRFFFHADGCVASAQTLAVLCRLLDHLTATENRRVLLERIIRYNGTDSFAALFHFLELLAPLAVQAGVENADTTAQLRTRSCLDPASLTSGRAGVAGAQQPRISLLGPGLSAPVTYFICLRNALEYLLSSKVAWETVSATEESRAMCGRWVNHFFNTVAARAVLSSGGVGVPPGAPHEDGDEVPGDYVQEERDDLDSPAAEEPEADDPALEPVAAPDDACVEQQQRAHLTQANLEDILVLALRAGARLSSTAVASLASQLREQIEVYAAAEHPEDDGRLPPHRMYVQMPPTKATAALEAAPMAVLPSPAQFVALVRGNCGFALPLSEPYLLVMLHVCDMHIFLLVTTTFVNSVKSNRPGPNARDDLEIAALVMETFFARVEESDAGVVDTTLLSPHAPAEVLLSLLKFLLHHVLYGQRTVRSLAGLAQDRDAPAYPGDTHADGRSATGDEESIQLKCLHGRAEDGFARAIGVLTREQVKDLALASLDHVEECFPKVAAYLYMRASQQLDQLSQSELLLVASRFPQSGAAVVTELGKHDIKLTVDFNDFLRVAKRLPTEVVEHIVAANLPALTFAWCTRLLSTLVIRHESLPSRTLARILKRAEGLIEDASEADRNLLLMVLQGYLNFGVSNPLADYVPKGEDDSLPMMAAPQQPEDEVHLDQDADTTTDTAATLIDGDVQARKDMILRTCDRLLRVETIVDLPTLKTFLSAYPSSLQSVTDAAVTKRAQSQVLRRLLTAPVKDVHALKEYAESLARHALFTTASSRRIKRLFFDDAAAWESLLEACDSRSLAASDGDKLTREQLLTQCVQLALLLPLASSPPVDSSSARAAADPAVVARDALQAVCKRFATPAEQLTILSLLADAAGTQHRRGGPHGGHARSHLGQQQHSSVVELLCSNLLLSADQLSASDFSRLVQNISRLRMWDGIKRGGSANNNGGGGVDAGTAWERFDANLTTALQRADAHSRCIVAKALSSDPSIFARYEGLVMGLLCDDVPVLSHDDLEQVLVAALQMRDTERVEQTLDAIGTKLLPSLQQCKRSTLVRLLQCHAKFNVRDDALLSGALEFLEEQSCRAGTTDVKLDVPQIITVLQSCVALDLELPEHFLILCFARFERVVEQLTFPLLAQACQLAVQLEMGYSPAINTIVSKLLESRDGVRQAKAYQGSIESVCDAYEVDVPQQLRQLRLRNRRERERLTAYWDSRAEQDCSLAEN